MSTVAAPFAGRPQRLRRPLLLAATALAALAAASPAHAALTAVAPPPLDPVTGTPFWYQDANGMKLELCDDGTPNCFGATPATFAPGVGPFYNRGVARVTVGTTLMESVLAVQGNLNSSGNSVVFNRIRSRVTGGTPNSTYTFTEPYGTQTVTTDAKGVGTTTQDVGCGAATFGPCNFAVALAAGVATPVGTVGPFLHWDTGAPAGYVGDARTPHTIALLPNGSVLSVTGPQSATQNLWVVTGKLFPGAFPIFASAPVAFPDQQVGTAGAPQTAMVTNNGSGPLVISSVSVAGANASDFAIAPGTDKCSGTSLATGASCTVGVKLTPAATGPRSASLAVADNILGGPNSIPLNGNGIVPSPAPTASPAPGTYTSAQLVNLADSDPAAVIHYTVDGSTPTAASAAAAGPIAVNSSETLKAIAIGKNGLLSSVASFAYVIQPPAAALRPVTLSSVRLAFSSIRIARHIKLSDARKRGLRVTLGLPAGTHSVHLRIMRRKGGRNRPGVVYQREFLTPAHAGLWWAALKFNGLTGGRYVLDVAPQGADGVLGSSRLGSFTIT
jgi:hypothetical protein